MTTDEIRALWVAALRSGEYKQGIGALRRHDEYCCLGVVCDVVHKHNLIPDAQWAVQELAEDGTYRYVPYDPELHQAFDLYFVIGDLDEPVTISDAVLPGPVAKLLGLSPSGLLSPALEFDGEPVNTLTFLNDNIRADFNQIADHIENGRVS